MHVLSRRHANIVIAVVVWAVVVATTAARQPVDGVAVLLGALACAPLAGRQRYPFAVLVVSAVAAEAYFVHYPAHQGSVVLAAPLIALYTLAEATTRRRALIIGVLAVLAFVGFHALIRPTVWLGADNIALAALGGLAVAAGDASRNRRAYLAEAQARAAHAEADREAEAQRRVTEDRLRIARDLHDAVGHHLALIHVQAGVVAHVLDDPPRPAREALEHIRVASKAALGELGDTIVLLRQPGDPAAPVQPVVGLAGLDELLGSFRRAGLVVTEQVVGTVRPVPGGADLTGYRIIQEALTNVRKHAGIPDVTVRLTYRPDTLRIDVDNAPPDRPADPDRGAGLGLIGMRERVTALGGTLRAGPRPDGGYRVTAELPAPSAAAT
ncbi:histidine kinase [Longispora sp. NPDC051575]|uniref:sensor histidine kinase n=1 Tax=Longispora sp. NPDC051575 TaxID=3154943 RepID=UPI0034163684